MAKKKETTKNVRTLNADTGIILHPRITEKAAKTGDQNCYIFDVAFGATKNEIKKAFTALYKQTPLKVHTVNKKPDWVVRRNIIGRTAKTKKAYIFLPKGVTIEVM